jgi:hypothetical protein
MTLRHRCRPRLIAKQERLMRLYSAVVAKMRNTPTRRGRVIREGVDAG